MNITVGSSRLAPHRGPVNIIFAVRGSQGFLNGSEVSELLRNLSVVEFSFYLGYPVLQIAEREWCSPGERGCECLRWWTSSNRIASRNPEYKSDKTGASQITQGWTSRALLSSQACFVILFREPRVLSKIIPVLEEVKPEGLSNRSVVTRGEGCEESSLE